MSIDRSEPLSESVAAALDYDKEQDEAPRLVAKGHDKMAEQIKQVARQNDVPIHEDADLAEVLASLELNQEIPEELFGAVAEVLAFIYQMNENP